MSIMQEMIFSTPKNVACESHAYGSCLCTLFFIQKDVVFPAEAEYSYFSADFHMT